MRMKLNYWLKDILFGNYILWMNSIKKVRRKNNDKKGENGTSYILGNMYIAYIC